jgi:glycosyltransferase involved in cell wall biosynthesis
MKFGFVSTMDGAPWGGSEALWTQAAVRLRQRGHAVCANVVRWPRMADGLRAVVNAGGEVQTREHPGSLKSKIFRKLRGDRSFEWLDRAKPDLLIINQGSNFDGVAWMHACKARGIAYIPIAHMASNACWPDSDTAERAADGYANAKHCWFVSHGNHLLTERQIARRLPRASVIRNPFGVDYHTPADWPADDGTVRLACVGRLCADAKGQDLILEVLSRPVWQERPIEVSFFGNGPSHQHLIRLAAMLGVKQVTFAGHVNDVRKIWSTHHALISASRFEGLPISIVEAMLCHRPAIVTDIPGNAELIEDGRTGFIAAAPTADRLDEAMERAWCAKDQLREMGLSAGRAIRGVVPADPIHAFVDLLEAQLTNAPERDVRKAGVAAAPIGA